MQNSQQNIALIRQLLIITCLMLVGMTAYESLKQFIDPHITIWESHTVTIFFSTICAAALSSYFLQRLDKKRAMIEELKNELEAALTDIQPLTGLLPICASCKNVRDDEGYWNQIESYIKQHINVDLSHGMCPDCMEKMYPEYAKRINANHKLGTH